MKRKFRSKSEADAETVVEEWGTLTWLASDALSDSEVTVGRVVIKPGSSNPRHAHDSCEEVLYLLQGQLTHSIGDDQVEMRAGDTIIVPAGVMHNAVNHGETDADMIVAYSSGTRDFRKEG
jgi:quercetin dioxygenase-like cupin family protein